MLGSTATDPYSLTKKEIPNIMGQTVITVDDKTLSTMTNYYQPYQTKTPQHAVFQAKTNGVTITAYRSKKVMFQGERSDEEATRWQSGPSIQAKPSSVNDHRYAPSKALFNQSIIGSDETGTGDYFGPITVVSAYVRADQVALLKELGVKDSKHLTDLSIVKLAKTILKLDLPYSLVVLHNEKYNQLQSRGWSQGKMKTMLHHTAISHLLTKLSPVKPDGILIDQFSTPQVYQKHLSSEGKQLHPNTYFMTKAESHAIAVATASILARYSFVKEMDKLSKQAGFTIPKGASKKVDQVAAQLIKQKGKEALTSYAKVHFKNTEKAATYL